MRFSLAAILLPILGALASPTTDLDVEAPSALHQRGCKLSPKPGLICGKHGEVLAPKFIDILRPFELATTFGDCRDICLGNPKCLSFLYNAPQLMCVPYGTDVPENKPVYLQILPGRLYSADCFDCSGNI